MFFIFSKVLLFLISPIIWVLALLIVAIIVKNSKRRYRLLLAAVAVFLLFSNSFLLNEFAKRWDIAPGPLKAAGPYSCAIVLGGFVMEDGHGKGLFSEAADRFLEGAKLKISGKVAHVLITGGNGNLIPDKFREADWAKTELQEFNIADSSILVEDRSRNTIENAAFSKTILEQKHLQPPYLLVTSAFHMRRALGIFKKEKLEVIPYPCNYLAGKGKFSFFQLIPDPETFSKWHLYIKEVVGTLVNYLR